ncbi:MAG: PA0069 family radical SAM protein [Burkholderiales bacterium]|nr:PA0069 family radical SAM protein [Burkholderiales bacterium]MBH2015251.1 PA0069 family radical SAM protein [Burkholderiales bacterium]
MDNDWAPLPDPRRLADPIKGRGTATRLAHRFQRDSREACDGGWPQDDDAGEAPLTQVVAERARSLLSRNDSPDIPFTWSINPYRGCEHGCIYCYARPTHSHLNLSPGLDFETRLSAKVNAAEVLTRELQRPSHVCTPIHLGSATDAYQPIERTWRLTRGVIEVLDACRHPFTIVTKSAGVERDLDLLVRAAARQQVYVMVSLTTLDADLCRRLEPRAAAPWRRLQTVRRLAEAGVPVAVNVAPIIPFLNEPEIERLIDAAAEAGAQAIHYTVVRLPWEVNPLFQGWLAQHVPERAERIMARIRDLRGGRDYDANFNHRMKGQGIWADLIRQRVRGASARHGLGHAGPVLDTSAFDPLLLRPPPAQGDLF